MPRIVPKSPELRQAQCTAFIDELTDEQTKQWLREKLNGLIHVSITGLHQALDQHQNMPDIERGERADQRDEMIDAEQITSVLPTYSNFLRTVDGRRYEPIRQRETLLVRYNDQFKPLVRQLTHEYSTLAKVTDHPNFIGAGVYSAAFQLVCDEQEYVVRIPHYTRPSPRTVERYLSGLLRTQGVPHLEQVVALSYEDGVTVAERMPGKPMNNSLTKDDISAITDQQLSDLVDTLARAIDCGVAIDPKPTNVLYDRQAGFGVIDYEAVLPWDDIARNLGEVTSWMVDPLMSAGLYGTDQMMLMGWDVYEYSKSVMAMNMTVLRRFRAIIEEKLPACDQVPAFQQIDMHLAAAQASLDDQERIGYIADLMDDNGDGVIYGCS